ncbi:MAG TPA: hypothetical protein VGC41_23890 [Kofleriaceae bacterium]
MVFLILVSVVVVIVVMAKASPASYARVKNRGLSARGILLQVSNVPMGTVGVGLQKLVRRQVYIDIEIPGQPPYEASVTALIPLNLVADVVPGATVELRVDQKDRFNIAIVGPGAGFAVATLQTQGVS